MGRPQRDARRPRGAVPDRRRSGPDLTGAYPRRPPDVSPGAVRSPNIWDHPAVYELENRAADPDRLIEQTMAGIATWHERTFLDLGCGSGYHLPRWADSEHGQARSVIGVEPHGGLVAMARRRVAGRQRVDVRQGSATDIPLPDASVDVVHARWAYFFGPGCEPGLREVERVLRRGGTAFVVDNDGSRSTFGRWFTQGYPNVDHDRVERFWRARGWERHPLMIRWSFTRREYFEAVVRIEFDRRTADAVITEHPTRPDGGVEVDYAVDLWSLTR